MTAVQTRRTAAARPTAADPLPDSENPRGLALLRSWEAAEKAMADPNDRRAMEQAGADLRASLRPAEAAEIATLIESLSVMYPQQSRTEADDRMRAKAWIADLAEYPADAIEAACIEWRRSDTPWMPTPGQLIAKIEPIVSHRRTLLKRAEKLFDEPAPKVEGPKEAPEMDERVADGLSQLAESLRGAE